MTDEKILLVDDEQALLDTLGSFLTRAGFIIETTNRGDSALVRIPEFKPDVIILDILLPGLDGREVCRRLRATGNWMPVIMLTHIGDSCERTLSLDEGADDYLNKPFDPRELIARIRALLRRTRLASSAHGAARHLTSQGLVLDCESRRVWHGDRELVLTSKAFAILEFLMLHPDQVITREQMLDRIWGWDAPVVTRTVDVRIAELRKQLDDDCDHPRFIETVIGVGYRFMAPVLHSK